MALRRAPPVFKPPFIDIVLDIGIAPGTGGRSDGDGAGGIGLEDGIAVGAGDTDIPGIGSIVISGTGAEVKEGDGEAKRALAGMTATVATKVIITSDRRSNRTGERPNILLSVV
jgi:hypothetical protein